MSHASQEAIKVAKEFIKGNKAKSPLTRIGTGDYLFYEKGRRVTTDGLVIKSYDWWPIAYRDTDGIWISNRPIPDRRVEFRKTKVLTNN